MNTKQIVILVLAAAVSITVVTMAVSGAEVYVPFSRAADQNRTVQVKGSWVSDTPADYDPKSNVFSFTMKDEEGKVVPVRYAGAKPNNFEMAEEVVVGGRLVDGTFEATSLLTKCPSKYEATEIEHPGGSY